MTTYDVLRQLPVARVVGSIHDAERYQAQSLLSHIPPNSVMLFDRGFPSYSFIQTLREHHGGYFLFRCPAQNTFPAIEAFIREGKKEDFILLTPSSNYLRTASTKRRKKANLIQLRVIRLESPDGTVSVLLTNLLNKINFSAEQIIELYSRRWAIEGIIETKGRARDRRVPWKDRQQRPPGTLCRGHYDSDREDSYGARLEEAEFRFWRMPVQKRHHGFSPRGSRSRSRQSAESRHNLLRNP